MIKILNKFNDGKLDCVVISKKDWSLLKRSIRTYMALNGWATKSSSKYLRNAERVLDEFTSGKEKRIG